MGCTFGTLLYLCTVLFKKLKNCINQVSIAIFKTNCVCNVHVFISDGLQLTLPQNEVPNASLHSPAKKFIHQSTHGTPVAFPLHQQTATGGATTPTNQMTGIIGSTVSLYHQQQSQFVIPLQYDIRGQHVLTVSQFSRQIVSFIL